MTGRLILLVFLLLIIVETKCFLPKIKLLRQRTSVRDFNSIDGEIIFGGGILLTTVVGSTIILNGKIEKSIGSNANMEKSIGELKADVKDVKTNFNYLYAGFTISIALFTGFNAVSDVLKNAASIQDQVAKTEEISQDKKKAAEFELFKRERDLNLLKKK